MVSKPNIACRIVKNRYPEEGSVVMAKIKSIHKDSVTLSLLEFNNLEGRLLLSHDDSCLTRSVLGRVEPLKAFVVDRRRRYVLLKRSTVTFAEKFLCEQEFNKRKYVHSVLESVAEDRDMSLKELYKLTKWPSYDELKKLDEADWLKADLGKKLSRFLLARIKLMKYNSWRIRDPSILRLYSIYQKLAVCWAFALIAQTEACLKLNGKLTRDIYLSVQDLINKGPKHLYGEDGDLEDLSDLADVLRYQGIVVEEDSPLTFDLDETPAENAGPPHKVKKMRVQSEVNGVPRGYLELMVMDALKYSPVCVSVVWFKSYIGRKDEGIFKPTPAEQIKFEEGKAAKRPCHCMLLTGDGVDKRGTAFLEMQDFNGDINNGDRGYLRFARDPSPILEYIEIEVENPIH